MKKIYLLFIFIVCSNLATAQKMTLGKQDNIDSVLQYYNNRKQTMKLAYSFKNIATIYNEDNNVKQALSYYNKSLKTYQEINDKAGIANSLFYIGKIINSQGNRKQALYYRNKSAKLKQEIVNELAIANSLNKLAFDYNEQQKTNLALQTYFKSLKFFFEINDKTGTVNVLNNMCTIYMALGDKSNSVKCYELSSRIKTDCKPRAQAIKAEMNSSDRIAYSFNNIAGIYLTKKNYALAKAYADSSLSIATQANYTHSICHADSLLAQLNLALANTEGLPASQKQTYLANSRNYQTQFALAQKSLQNVNPQTNTGNKPKPKNTQSAALSFTLVKVAGIFVFLVSALLMLVYIFIKKKRAALQSKN